MALDPISLVTIPDSQGPVTVQMRDGGTMTVAFRQSVAPSPPIFVPLTTYVLTPRDPSLQAAGALVVAEAALSLNAPVPLLNRRIVIPVTAYGLNAPAPLVTSLSLQEIDNELVGTGSGNFTISVTSPAPYIGGPYATDLSVEGGGSLNFEALLTAPQCFFAPIIVRTAVAPGGSQNKVGDTFTRTRGLWVYDADDSATVAQAGQWHLDGSPISGATGETYTATAPGVLEWVDAVTGAGAARSAESNAITIAAVSQQIAVPVTTYGLTVPEPFVNFGTWDITAGEGSATINGFPAVPTSPAWDITVGDGSATINDFPGGA